MGVWIDKLLERIEGHQVWPTGKYKRVSKDLGLWIAFRESERDRLKLDIDWEDSNRYYQIDPLAPKISDAFASLLYGRRPDIQPASPKSEARFDEIAEENGFPANLQRGVRTSSSEGEVCWRVRADPELSGVPLVEWYSRTATYPLFIGPKLAALAFISRYDTDDDKQNMNAEVFRHFEIHERGEVQHHLFRGTRGTLGQHVDLDAFSETRGLKDQWLHGLPAMLCGRIPNIEGIDPTLGVSDYHRIKDLLHDLNEALTIGAENARMTLKQRMIAPPGAFDEEGNVRDVEVWRADDSQDDEPDMSGQSKGSPFRVLEYDFKAAQIIEWRRGLAEDALGRIGIVAQFVGAGSTTEGLATSGTALKVRLIPTTAAGEERGQYWDDKRAGLPGILAVCAMVDQLSVADGGFGVNWVDAEVAPGVERGSTLPEDETEVVDRNVAAVSGQVRSRQTAVEEQHPDWSDELVAEELERIKRDMQDSRPMAGIFDNLRNQGEGTPGGGDEGSEETQ